MDDHTAYVELLAELEGVGKAPAWSTEYPSWKLCYIEQETIQYVWRDSIGRSHSALKNDAHNTIRVAAEDMLREWCKAQGSYLKIDDQDEVLLAAKGFGVLGTGPTLAVALLNAVRHIRKETP